MYKTFIHKSTGEYLKLDYLTGKFNAFPVPVLFPMSITTEKVANHAKKSTGVTVEFKDTEITVVDVVHKDGNPMVYFSVIGYDDYGVNEQGNIGQGVTITVGGINSYETHQMLTHLFYLAIKDNEFVMDSMIAALYEYHKENQQSND